MPLTIRENKLLEITREPYFEDIEWEYCIFGAEGRRGDMTFSQGFRYEAQSFFEVSNMRLALF